jgi:hypothetical protein
MCAIIVAPQLRVYAAVGIVLLRQQIFRNCRKYGEKSKMSARRQFLGEGHPPVFADVGEGKELRTGSAEGGEALDLRRKWKFENGKWEEGRAEGRKWKLENRKWDGGGAERRKWKIENGPPSRESIVSAG